MSQVSLTVGVGKVS